MLLPCPGIKACTIPEHKRGYHQVGGGACQIDRRPHPVRHAAVEPSL